MSTLPVVELGVLGPLQVRLGGTPVMIPGAKPRAILTMLGLHCHSVVSADTLVELLWGDDPPRTAGKALQTHISSLRHTLGDGFVLTQGTGWTVNTTQIDALHYKSAAKMGRDASAAGDTSGAVARFEEASALWRGIPELPNTQRGLSERTRWIEGHAALLEDRADALLATGRAAEIIGELEAAVADAPLRERRWGQLMLALYRAGRQGEALGAYKRAHSLLADELGVDPGPDLRRLEAAIVAQDSALDTPVSQHIPTVTRAVTFLLTDIEGSTAAWEAEADAMAAALARHDELVEQVVTSRGGRLIKTRGEGDATFSVFERPSAAAAAAIELQDAIYHEPWALREPMRIRVALHTGEVELRDGDYFGRAVNRAARLRSLAAGGQILCSGATAELVIDSLPDDVVLADLGMRQLRNLARPEHVFELRLETAEDRTEAPEEEPMERPGLPAVLAGRGPFVGRRHELEGLLSAWQTVLAGGMHAVLIAGEPGVGKTRLAGEWSRHAYEQGAVVLYGRCDEDLGAPYQPFAEGLRSLLRCVGSERLRELRGVEALLPLVPSLTDVLPDLAPPARADPDTERYALFDAVVALLGVAAASAPVVLVLDDLHWAAKPTLLLLRHLLRFGEKDRVQIVGTYRSTDLDRSHPLAAMLADLHRDGTANRIHLSGLDEQDVTEYVAEAGYDDEELARALASVTGGNPFFLIEALRHVDESGGVWDPSTLPQGVREAVSRRLSRLPAETNKALAAAAVVGSRFALDLVERVVEQDLVDAFEEACKAGIVIEEPGGRYRFNHALVRQSLLAELASVRRMRLHQRIATTLETEPGADNELLADLAHHYFECAWAGNAAKAVEYCRRAADQAMSRLAYEGAADLYDHALHAMEELDEELRDRDDQVAELLVARCEALLAAGDVASAAGAVAQLQEAARESVRLAAWGTCFDGQLSMLTDPERLDEIESAVGKAAESLAELDDAAGEANAHTVRAGCLARLGRIGDCEIALDNALTAARRAREHRRVNAVLANAPLAALWGPNPVPRAGGRCLDVVRLLRITTGSPVVEAASTRCQAVLEAFRGRAVAGRRMIDSARRTLTELGLRHALLEVDQFAGIVELVADDPGAAEPHLRRAYAGFRRMGLDADTAETAALLARACLALDRDVEADELCMESERLAGHALKASIAWRTVRAQLLARRGDHVEAKRVAEEAVAVAERTDGLVHHGDACLTLATVLEAAGDIAGARVAAERAVDLYERKGAAALAEKARRLLSEQAVPAPPPASEEPTAQLDHPCVRVIHQLEAAFERGAWDECEQFYAPNVFVESRRKMVGFSQADLSSGDWPRAARHLREGWAWQRTAVIGVRGERLALTRLDLGTDDVSPGAPHEEMLGLCGLDEDGRIALHVFFDVEDIDVAIAELDAMHARFEERHSRAPLKNAATRANDRFVELFASRRWDEISAMLAGDLLVDDRRRGLRRTSRGRTTELANMRAVVELGVVRATMTPLALRGERLCLSRGTFEGHWSEPDAPGGEMLVITEVDADGVAVARIDFDPDDFEAAIAELDARYLAGEAAAYSSTWSVITAGNAALNRHELPPSTPEFVNIDHRRGTAFAPGELIPYVRAGWDLDQNIRTYIETVHRVSDLGAVFTWAGSGTSQEDFVADWRGVNLVTVEGEKVNRSEIFDEADLDVAITKFDQLNRPTTRLENAARRVYERFWTCFADRDWAAMAEMYAEDISVDDRRRPVGAGVLQGREINIANMQALAELGTADEMTSTAIATRGERLALSRLHSPAVQTEVLNIIETDADERIVALVAFDADDFETAFAELDIRYLAGEAAPYAQTWQMVMDGLGAFNRHELPPTTWGEVGYTDHRRVPFGPGEFGQAITELWELVPDARYRTRAVHALDSHGVVATLVIEGTDVHDNELQWARPALVAFAPGHTNVEVYEEDDLDAALARFEELRPHTRPLENAASRVQERYLAHFATRDWKTMTQMVAEDFLGDDRRRMVNSGVRRGRDAEIANFQVIADLGGMSITSAPIATRGARLVVSRDLFNAPDSPAPVYLEAIDVVEINADNRIAACITFEPGEIDAAIAELDARYLAGEAADHAHTWSVIASSYAAFNRHEVPTAELVIIDHRRATPVEPSNMTPSIRTIWDLTPDLSIHIEAVHRLNNCGAVITHKGHGSSQEGFDAEWRAIDLLTVDGEIINRCDVFDEADLDAAIAKFEQLSRPAPTIENAATQIIERFLTSFAAGDWDAIADIFAADYSWDDRRRVVNAGTRQGRTAAIEDLRTAADVGITNAASTVIATRGAHLALTRSHWSVADQRPEPFRMDVLQVAEVDADERVAASVAFDPDDLDAAYEELDARYLAGEAAPFAHAWQILVNGLDELNRHEPVPMVRDATFVDHRRVPFAPGNFGRVVEELWTLVPDARYRVNAVHALDSHGAVASLVVEGTDVHGNELQWFAIDLVSFATRQPSVEVYDEDDLDTALARFEELRPHSKRLENSASRMYERFNACLAARDWDAMAQMVADDACDDDRRRVVSGGIQRGRDAVMGNLRAVVGVGVKNYESTAIATRGDRLALTRTRVSGGGQPAEAFGLEMLTVIEVDTDNRIAAGITFDLDDVDAAFEELDARYLAGEAAAHSEIWSAITRAYAVLNRRGLPATTPDWVNVDHRRGAAFAPGDMTAYISAAWDDLEQDLCIHIEAVHRLGKRGAVLTQVLKGTTRDGFDAEWRTINLYTVDGDLISRCELFDEADLEGAIARFEEVHSHTRRLENAASQLTERYWTYFGARDWAALGEIVADDVSADDRRRVVNAGIRCGRDAEIADMHAISETGTTNATCTVIAIRGERLALMHFHLSGRDQRPGAFHSEMLGIAEIEDNRLAARVLFDLDDIDAAFAELEARYIAGEAAVHAHTWSAITAGYAAFNRHELPGTTPNWVNIDHRRGRAFAPGEQIQYIRATWDLMPQASAYTEIVHWLSSGGAIVTQAVKGTSTTGFDAEWREIAIVTIDGDLISRCEMFDEEDIDAALARFDELDQPAPRLENLASQLTERYWRYFTARDWIAMAELLADDNLSEDRRPVVNSGVRHGRDAEIANMQAMSDLGARHVTLSVIATRGERLVLCRFLVSIEDPESESYRAEGVGVVEINAEQRIAARIMFDVDQLVQAFEELDARYIAGEAAAHAHTWSVVTRGFAAVNRRELPATTPDWVNVDRRRIAMIGPGDAGAYLRAMFESTPQASVYVEAVHRLSDFGVVVTYVASHTSEDGFDGEWRVIDLLTVEGELISRGEIFDEEDLDAALARFDELDQQVPQLENAATRTWTRLADAFNRRDLDGFLALITEDGRIEDRRKGLRALLEGPARRAGVHALFETAPGSWWMEVEPIAIRGSRLSLTRERYRDIDDPHQSIVVELLTVMELGDSDLVRDTVDFDADDIDAAFEELDARYLAGEAADHAHTWSVIADACASLNRRELPPMTADCVSIDHRRLAPADDLRAYLRATWDMSPQSRIYIEAVHRLTNLGAVVTHVVHGTSQDGFDAEWRFIDITTVDGDLVNRSEIFDEADIATALARFDELNQRRPQRENAATRTWARLVDAFNRRDLDGFLALHDGRYEDRRRGLRNEGPVSPEVARALFEAPASWRLETETIAVRGNRLGLTRAKFRDTDEADRPIAVELLMLTDVNDGELVSYAANFDPDDINDAFAELTARWVASGEVAHPEVIEAWHGFIVATNRHDFDELARLSAGATFVNHRQLRAGDNIADYLSSMRTLVSLTPNMWIEVGEIITHSATSLVTDIVVKGTTAQDIPIELPAVLLLQFNGDRLVHMEALDPDQRDLALARFQELNPA